MLITIERVDLKPLADIVRFRKNFVFIYCFAYEKLYCIFDSFLPSFNRLRPATTENRDEKMFCHPNGYFSCGGGFNHIVIFQFEDFR